MHAVFEDPLPVDPDIADAGRQLPGILKPGSIISLFRNKDHHIGSIADVQRFTATSALRSDRDVGSTSMDVVVTANVNKNDLSLAAPQEHLDSVGATDSNGKITIESAMQRGKV